MQDCAAICLRKADEKVRSHIRSLHAAVTVRHGTGIRHNRFHPIAAYAEKVRLQWKIPGMSLAVIHGDSTVLMQGFGVKEKGGGDPVTPSTLFHIGSMTKAFTATVIASLVDEGLLSWDDRVKDILPDFDWYDDSVEAVMQVHDLLTHSTGLVAQAGTYIPNLGYNRDDVYRMFRYIEPVYPFREHFAYNNITFIIAARIIETVTGKPWEDNIRERIFKPLDMSSSVPGSEGYKAAGKRASPSMSLRCTERRGPCTGWT